VKQNGSLSLMPCSELKAIEFIYTVFGNVMDASTGFSNSLKSRARLPDARPMATFHHATSKNS
jgi:hypothetical protein